MQGFYTRAKNSKHAHSMRTGNFVSEIDSLSTEKDIIKRFTMTLSFLIILMRFARKASKELVFNLLHFHLHVCSLLHTQVCTPVLENCTKRTVKRSKEGQLS